MLTKHEIEQAVESLREELVAFIQTLVRTPSLPDEEEAVQQIVAGKLQELGLETTILTTDFAELVGHPAFSDDGFSPDSRVNVVGKWAGVGNPAGHHSLILNGHVDVVYVGDENQWDASPWSGLVKDGKIFGRGSCDMKSGIATGIFAIKALQRLGFRPGHDVIMESVIGEETGGVGTLTTLVKGITADAALILEPTDMILCPVQAGSLTFRLVVPGRAAHGALRWEGVSAIEKFYLLHQAILELERERHLAYPEHPLYDDPMHIAPISIGLLQAGDWPSTVPETLVAEGRMGVFPGEPIAEVRKALEEVVNRVADGDEWLRVNRPLLTWVEGQFEAGETPLDHPLITTLSQTHEAITQKPAQLKGVTYGSDLRLFTNNGQIPAVLYGAGDVRLAHSVNEHILLEDVIQATKVVAQMIVNWCGNSLSK